jgi:hypothetical protein
MLILTIRLWLWVRANGLLVEIGESVPGEMC